MSKYAPDIVAFLEARLAEAELLANKAGIHPGLHWQKPDERSAVIDVHGGDGFMYTLIYDEGGHDATDADFIVFWQPSRILAFVASQRRIIDRYKATRPSGPSSFQQAQYVILGEVLIDLASLWREHPDWHETWEVQ